MDEPHRSLERPGRPRHPRVGEQRRGHGRPRRVRRGGAFHIESSPARVSRIAAWGIAERDGVLERRDREPEDDRHRTRRRCRHVHATQPRARRLIASQSVTPTS